MDREIALIDAKMVWLSKAQGATSRSIVPLKKRERLKSCTIDRQRRFFFCACKDSLSLASDARSCISAALMQPA